MFKETCPETKFQESLGYKSIIVIPTMQKASFVFLFQRNCSRSLDFRSESKYGAIRTNQRKAMKSLPVRI